MQRKCRSWRSLRFCHQQDEDMPDGCCSLSRGCGYQQYCVFHFVENWDSWTWWSWVLILSLFQFKWFCDCMLDSYECVLMLKWRLPINSSEIDGWTRIQASFVLFLESFIVLWRTLSVFLWLEMIKLSLHWLLPLDNEWHTSKEFLERIVSFKDQLEDRCEVWVSWSLHLIVNLVLLEFILICLYDQLGDVQITNANSIYYLWFHLEKKQKPYWLPAVSWLALLFWFLFTNPSWKCCLFSVVQLSYWIWCITAKERMRIVTMMTAHHSALVWFLQVKFKFCSEV